MYKLTKVLPLLAVILGLVFLSQQAISFTKKHKDSDFWLYDSSIGTPLEPESYTKANNPQPESCDQQAAVLCGVHAPEGTNGPDLSALIADLDADESQINYDGVNIIRGPYDQFK